MNIETAEFKDILSEKYLAYALSTIMSRSLPDVRDGLKPVHRRLLYAMHQLKLGHSSAFKKCARVVGDVIGKYHPHGEIAIYDTLVRLAQSFTMRYPLIDGQGNFGSIDGDNAASMRYTESKLTKIASYMIHDLENDAVDFKDTYDNSDTEPVLLPAAFPNILANGSEGIAVGMATSIPPHNLGELITALLLLIDNPNTTIDEILTHVTGPDFPTGGIVVENVDHIKNIYTTGRGSVRIRAKWEQEELGHGLYQIIITEIPFQVQKSKLIESLANLLRDKKIPLVNNIRDESTDVVRIIIEPKSRKCDAIVVMESLFMQTELESRFNFNMNVLNSAGLPMVMDLKSILTEFLAYRFEVVVRRSKHHASKINHRLEILDGLKTIYQNLDEVIRIIRDEDDPKQVLILSFKLTDIQAEAILNIRLRSLRKIEEMAINAEYNQLSENLLILLEIINNPTSCWKVIRNELEAFDADLRADLRNDATTYNRRTFIAGREPEKVEISLDAIIERESVTIVCSTFGWMKSLKGHSSDAGSWKFRDGDSYFMSIQCYNTDYFIVATANGRFYSVLADNISKKTHGESIKMLIETSDDDAIIGLFKYDPTMKVLVVSDAGYGFIVMSEDIISHTKLGKQIMILGDGCRCIKASPLTDADMSDGMIACVSSARKIVVFRVDEVPVLKKGRGVTLQKLNKDDTLKDVQVFASGNGFVWRGKDGVERKQPNFSPWQGKRGGSGKVPPVGFSKNNTFI
jgi:topoisomerase-4 subunit A